MIDTTPTLPPVNRQSPGKKACAAIGACSGLVGAAVFGLVVYGALVWMGKVGYVPLLAVGSVFWNCVLPATVVSVLCGACVGAVVGADIGGWRLATLGIVLAVTLAALVAPLVLVAWAEVAHPLSELVMLLLPGGRIFGVLFFAPASFGGLVAAATYRAAVLAYRRGSMS